MVKLKIELFRYGYLVGGKILEQDKSLRCNESLWKSSSGKFAFFSFHTPQLVRAGLYLRGSNSSGDDIEFHCQFSSELEAEQCMAYIRKGVAATNAVEKTPPAIIELEHIK